MAEHRALNAKVVGSMPTVPAVKVGETWQDNYSVVSSVEASRRTASSAATEPGDVRRASRSSGQRQSASWFIDQGLPRPLANGPPRLDEVTGVTERRCARLLIGITRVRIPAPVLALGSRAKRALLVQQISTPRYERGNMGAIPVEGICGRSSDGRAAV